MVAGNEWLLVCVFLQELGCVPTTFANIDDFCMELIPFDNDLLSMEMELSFRVTVIKNKFLRRDGFAVATKAKLNDWFS